MKTAVGLVARLTVTLLLVAGATFAGAPGAFAGDLPGVATAGGVPSASGTHLTAVRKSNGPSIEVAEREVDEGRTVEVSGSDWRPDTVVTLMLCGQNALSGTEDCANTDSRAVTTSSRGDFGTRLPVVEPPKPCPCVIKAVAVTGEHASAEAEFIVPGHPVRELPNERGAERLAVLDARLEGSSGVLNWFGAPPERKLVLTVTNQGTGTARNPEFGVGTAQGVFAHDWAEQRWSGTLEPGQRKTVTLDVRLPAGAHGSYRVGAQYGQTVLAEQPWEVGRPWGLTLLALVVLAVAGWALYWSGRALFARLRPHASRARARTVRPDSALARFGSRLDTWAEPADDVNRPPRTPKPKRRGPRLPWITPDQPPGEPARTGTTVGSEAEGRPDRQAEGAERAEEGVNAASPSPRPPASR